MFCVDDSTAQVIQRAHDEGGEFSAAIELRRHFRGIVDLATARRCARIVGWTPVSPVSATDGAQAGTVIELSRHRLKRIRSPAR